MMSVNSLFIMRLNVQLMKSLEAKYENSNERFIKNSHFLGKTILEVNQILKKNLKFAF